MQTQAKVVAPALRALLEKFIDYAGLFPPASVDLKQALLNYSNYADSDFSWILRWFVVERGKLTELPESFNGRLSVLCDADEKRAATIESKSAVSSERPVYWEVSTQNLNELDAVKAAGCFAKIRMGGLKPEAIPSPAAVASFIHACAERKLAFKATAGLHHPLRSEQSLSYEPDAPRAIMHGFINVLMAAAFAYHGDRDIVQAVLEERNPEAFRFDDAAHWHDKRLRVSQIKEARESFIHSVGSCSFEEPVQELKDLHLL